MEMPKRLMISAGESSGELYGALLSRELKRVWHDVEIIGIGGSHMKSEGVSLIATISHVMGITEAIKHLFIIRETFKKAKQTLIEQRPDILILIDYPDFNIALAKHAKSLGIPILYYVSPQVWAWRRGRVKKITGLANKIAVLFPFEADIYKDTGLPVEFVGHPITETINITETREELKQKLQLNPAKSVISLLPGSRPSEIKRHMPIIKGVAERIYNELPGYQIVIPLAPETELKEEIPGYITVLKNLTPQAIACSDVSAVASGTATLQTALLGIPMVVFYKVSPLTFCFAKLLVKVKFISIVNILSKKEIVKELIQRKATTQNIFLEIKKIITDNKYREEIISNLDKIKNLFSGKTASTHVTKIVGELAGWNTTGAY
ncbi:MAG: lipid-A-disaccharide synthase [Nitrospirae bacterium]|nr:lipid-A-disaccharide synthase [Nitrospirota bacterium]